MRLLTVTDGRRGIFNQAAGLAEAIQRECSRDCILTHHTLAHGRNFAALPPKLQRLAPHKLRLPDADLIIGCGRQAIAPLIEARRSSTGPFTVYIQDPRLNPSNFDLVVMPEHDVRTTQDTSNIEPMIGSPNRVTRDFIVMETSAHTEQLSELPMPRAMISIGGPSKRHKLTAENQFQHLAAAKALLEQGYSLLITTSRRTPESVTKIWEDLAADHAKIWLHTPESEDENPYFAFLGGADIILVTEDSTNMLTEACATGKPVFRLPMDGKAGKFEALYSALEAHCHVTLWAGQTSGPAYDPLNETQRIANRVIALFEAQS